MKKGILLLAAAGILLCSCSMKKEENELRSPGELKYMKDSFSVIYRIMLTDKNGNALPTDGTEEEAVAVAAGFSYTFDDAEQTLRNFDKSYYYLKECLKYMEDMRLVLSEDGVDPKLIDGLDLAVSRLAHYMNEENDTEAMKAVNDGIYIIGAISEYYGGRCRACTLRVEYCLNLLEIESDNPDGLLDAIALTDSMLSELESALNGECAREIAQMEKSLESLKTATKFYDARLIRMKVEIMRSNLKKISAVQTERE